MKKSFQPLLAVMVLLVASLACSFSGKNTPTNPENEISTRVAQTVAAQATLPPSQTPVVITATPAATNVPDILPKPVYYLMRDDQGRDQMNRMDVDGTSKTITNGQTDILEYDVSLKTGQIAIVTDNQLAIIDQAGVQSTVVAQDDPKDENSSLWYGKKAVEHPVWSNDGTRLAFYHGGLNIYDSRDKSIKVIRQNTFETNLDSYARELYYPVSWSPDDTRLIVSITYGEGGTQGLYSFADDQLIKLEKGDGGGVCCGGVWSTDGKWFYTAGFSYGGATSDLWAFDGKTGKASVVVPPESGDGKYYYSDFPGIAGDKLYFYYASLKDYPTGQTPCSMARSAQTFPAQPELLRNDSQVLDEVLWAPDGSFALAVKRVSDDLPFRGDLLLIPTGNGEIKTLPAKSAVHMIKWGL